MTLLILFVVFLLIDLSTRFYLALRQIAYIKKHRAAVPNAFSHHISLFSHQRAADYSIARTFLQTIELSVEAAILVGLLLFGGLAFLDKFWASIFSSDWLQQLSLLGSVVAISALVQLPFTLWRIFKLEQRYNFNRMSLSLFWMDQLKGLIVILVLGIPLISAILGLMAKAGNAWPWWAWGIWVGFSLSIMWLFPTVIAPLFNTFKPLDKPGLQKRIYDLAQRCNFKVNGLFIMDGSKRSAHGNAYFTGIGNNKRIVFFDTLLNKLNEEEIEAVLAHELGHFAHKHIIKRLMLSFSVALFFFLVLGWLSQQLWFYTSFGIMPHIDRSNDGLALVLFFLVTPVFTFWFSPLFNWLSRKDEYQADAYAAKHSNPEHLVNALLKLYDDNAATLTPDPLYSAYYASHPPATQRIAYLTQFYETNQTPSP